MHSDNNSFYTNDWLTLLLIYSERHGDSPRVPFAERKRARRHRLRDGLLHGASGPGEAPPEPEHPGETLEDPPRLGGDHYNEEVRR